MRLFSEQSPGRQVPFDGLFRRGTRTLVLCAVLGSIAASVQAQPPEISPPDLAARATALFQHAVDLQLRGEATQDPALLAAAVERYREVLAVKPDSASTWYNLARIHQFQGDRAAAREAYAKAAELGGGNDRFYRFQQASYLRSQGDCAAAAPLFEGLALGEGRSREAHEGMVSCFAGGPLRGDERFPLYLWRLLAAGEVVSAREAALAAIEAGWPAPARRELLTLVAESLGRSYSAPGAYLGSEEARRIGRLDPGDGLGSAPRELLLAYRIAEKPSGGHRGSDLFPSWREGGSGGDEAAALGASPRAAMTSLLLALGEWQRQQARSQEAEALFRLAVTLDPEKIEVRAIEKLVDLEVALGDVEKVDRLLSEFEGALFKGKAAAYVEGRPDEIYEFHRTLGELYGYLASTGKRPWGDAGDPRGATFQLQRAWDTWTEIETAAKPALDPGVVELLARCYQAGGESQRAATLRVEAATQLDTRGDARGRDVLIRRVDETTLPPLEKQKYEVLRSKPAPVSKGALVGAAVVGTAKLDSSGLAAKAATAPAVDAKAAAAAAFEPKAAGAIALGDAKSLAVSRLRPDLRRALAGGLGSLTLFTGRADVPVPESAAQELAAVLAAWLEGGKGAAGRYRRADARPSQVRSWDGSRGVAVLVVDGKEVEIPFAVANE